ncbi:MAG: ComEC/Rec2 family competence protein [Treponema sp.]|jgi:competence protein ComEC|nr:ComEC/Rec2 family competence protein [Treponema sp.]
MVSRLKLSPVLCAAAGAAAGFYGLSVLFQTGVIGVYGIFAVFLILTATLCLLRVLVSFPAFYPAKMTGENSGEDRLLQDQPPPDFRLLRPLGAASPARALSRAIPGGPANRYAIAFAAGLALGLSAGRAAASGISFGIPGHTVKAVSGVLLEDPRIVSGGRAMVSLSLRESSGGKGLRVSARGELPVFFPAESAARLKEFGRGSLVFAEGYLRVSSRGTEERASWLFSAESLHLVKPASALDRFRTGVRLDLIRRFDNAPAGNGVSRENGGSRGGLALALLLGVRDNLDSGLAALYRDAGCSYVLALSGMHLAVLAGIIALLLKKPLGPRPAAIAGALIIILYCFIVGPLPSLTRAALMYLLGALAVLGALNRDALSLLCMAFLVQIVVSPQSGFSLSFVLSYLALAGILSAGESLNGIFRGKAPAFLLGPLSASAGAFLATAGVTACFFGTLRPVGIITGLVLVPLTTAFMIGSLACLALGLVSPFLAGFLNPALSLLYVLMEKTVSLAGRFPGLVPGSPPLVIALSLALWLFLIYFEHRLRITKNRLPAFA